MTAFHEQLRQWREAAGLTQAEVAARTGRVSHTYISKLESGRINPPSLVIADGMLGFRVVGGGR